MYPFLRLALVLARARAKPRIAPDEPADLELTAWPWDCDVYAELNNGRQLTIFDLGRFDFGVRIGLVQLLRQKRWGFVVGGSSMQYRRRIRPFQRFTLRTRMVSRDEKWFYAVQTTYVAGAPCSQGLVRATVSAAKGGTVPTDEVATALGHPNWRPAHPDWVRAWSEADRVRPWPPEPLADGPRPAAEPTA